MKIFIIITDGRKDLPLIMDGKLCEYYYSIQFNSTLPD